MRFVFIVVFFMLSACGSGSGSGGVQNIPSKSFELKYLNTITQGVVYSTYLKNEYNTYGIFTLVNEPEEVFNGVLVTPRLLTFRAMNSLHGSGSIPNNGWDIKYYIETATGNVISLKVKSLFSVDWISCKSSSPYHMPVSVKSGDSDTMPTFACENQKNLDEASWHAIANTNNTIKLSLISKTIDLFGNVKQNDISYVLDTSGAIISVSLDGYVSIPTT